MLDAASVDQGSRGHRLLRTAIDGLLPGLAGDAWFTLRYPDGSQTQAGNPAGRPLALHITSWSAASRIRLNPGLAFGEAYMDGTMVPLGCTIYDILDMLLTARMNGNLGRVAAFRESLTRVSKRINQFNPTRLSRRNVERHYEFGLDFYRQILDEDLQYSCAYFRRGDETLDEAQRAKKAHIAAKLLLTRPGLRVLDIGCGWGGMAMTLARDYGAEVTGITLSGQQLEIARARAAEAGLADRVKFELLDYRAIPFSFDRIVSIGMFEHVGINHYNRFFDIIRNSLEPDGVALIHSIGRSFGPNATNPWIRKHIFPGGYSPALSEVLPAVERSGLIATDIEMLRLHYARTLACWRENLMRRRGEILARHDERFLRMFEFYLSGSEVGFRRSGYMVWQMQLARQHAAVPLARDYLEHFPSHLARK